MKKILQNRFVRAFLIALKLVYIPFLVNGQNTCSGTLNYSAMSNVAPYTRIGNGTSGAIRLCLTANSLTGKCAGVNSAIVIYACLDATCSNTNGILAVWDQNTPVGTCLTTYLDATTCNGYIRVRRFCGGGSASVSWTTVNGLTNACTSGSISPNTNGTDCITPTPLCTSGTYPGNASGAGFQELGCGSSATNRGCLLNGENNSAWYTFKALTNGTITLNIAPATNKDDYDFAIWSGTNCPPTVAPIRCSYALGKGPTGLNNVAVDNSEGQAGDGWVNDLTVLAGQTYTLLIDGFATAVDPDYTLTFGGTASLDCGVLPVKYLDFKAKYEGENIKIEFSTEREFNNKYFEVEKSYDGINYFVLRRIENVNNSDSKAEYVLYDSEPSSEQYYRIKQTDNNLKSSYTNTVHLKNNDFSKFYIFPKSFNEQLEINTDGEYSDVKIFDSLGKEVFSSNVYASTSISTIGFKSGIYTLIAKDNYGNIKVFKLTK